MNINTSKKLLKILSIFLFIGLAGCDQFQPREAGLIPVHLDKVNTGVCPMTFSIGDKQWQLDYLGFYITNPEVRIDGKWQRVKFRPSPWQTKDVALLKFQGACGDAESSNTKIALDTTDAFMKLSTSLRFTIGLPFDINHANPLEQPSPLNDSSMFWSWQTGHKFLRLDIKAADDPAQSFSYHLGSVGCESPSAMRPPEKACAFSNRVNMILPMTQLDTDLDLTISVPVMLKQVALTESKGCMFDLPDTPACDRLMRNLVNRPWLAWQ